MESLVRGLHDLKRIGTLAALLVGAGFSLSCQSPMPLLSSLVQPGAQTASGPMVGALATPSSTPLRTPTRTVLSQTPTPLLKPVISSPQATVIAVPPLAPVPRGTPAAPESEADAASRMIPIPKVTLPRGPRKAPPNRLIIPSIGVDTKVIELGTYYNAQGELLWETAPFAAGHHIGTANPGEEGNMVISGHISSIHEGAVFKRLPQIQVGDGIVVATNDRDYLYRVVNKKVVDPTQVDVMNSTSEEILTIITCVPDGVYSHRLVVTAVRI